MQRRMLARLLRRGAQTDFGRAHDFAAIGTVGLPAAGSAAHLRSVLARVVGPQLSPRRRHDLARTDSLLRQLFRHYAGRDQAHPAE